MGIFNGLVRSIGNRGLPLILLLGLTAVDSNAEYNRVPESRIDLKVFNIDQEKFLGNKIDGSYKLTDGQGNRFQLKEILGKPVILVLSYFKCDGVCSAVNADLKNMIENVDRMKIGEHYNVLTLSFDKYDNQDSIRMFSKELNLSREMENGWTLAAMENPEDIEKITKSVGFKYFWSPRDRTFFHPNVYMFLSPQGRVARYLFANTIESKDIELALLEAGKELIKPTEVLNLFISYCYSYNYKEGKYTYNIPLFVAIGALTLGVTSFLVAVTVFKRKLKKVGNLKEVG